MPETYHNVTIQDTEWGFLYGLPDLKNGGTLRPGEKYDFGRRDPETGEPYLYQIEGHDQNTGQALISRDYEASHVYSSKVFIWGWDDRNTPLEADVLYEYLTKMKVRTTGFWEPVRVHRGYTGGVATWHHALRSETNIGPGFHDVVKGLEPFIQEWNFYSPLPRRIELLIPTT